MTVVNAHPRIGESAAVVRQTSALSYREQGYEAEAGLSADELERVYAELARLNAAYEALHGFRFVVFVNGRPKAAILEVLRERIARPREQELGRRSTRCSPSRGTGCEPCEQPEMSRQEGVSTGASQLAAPYLSARLLRDPIGNVMIFLAGERLGCPGVDAPDSRRPW